MVERTKKQKTKKEKSDKSRFSVFADWIIVKSGSEVALVNPVNIENVWPSKDGTIVSLVSGKKLVDERFIDDFIAEERSRILGPMIDNFCDSLKQLKPKPKPKPLTKV